MKRPAVPLPVIIVASVATFAVALIFVAFRPPLSTGAPPLLVCGAVALFYLLSHLMRAARMAVIAMPLLGISFRSAVLLHLTVAPWTLLLPLKLDELIRLNELSRLSAAPERAVGAILIDRSLDGIILVPLALLLQAAGFTALAGFIGVIGGALMLLAAGFLLLPFLLETIQRQLFIYNHGERGLRALRQIDRARLLVSMMRQAAGQGALFLLLATIGIWVLELFAVWLFLAGLPGPRGSIASSAQLMLQRADQTWNNLMLSTGGADLFVQLTTVLLVPLLLLWVPAMILYRRRCPSEPGRPRLPQQTGFASIAVSGGRRP